MMSSATLETFAKELMTLGRKINKISRSNSISSQTQTTSRKLTNNYLKAMVGDYNAIARKVNENSEHEVVEYTINETTNSNGETVVTATNN